MCIRDRSGNTESFVTRLKDYLLSQYKRIEVQKILIKDLVKEGKNFYEMDHPYVCLLYTSDAADEARSVDLDGGRNINKKKNTIN
ncbi:class Ib ribonucleoside-diphosphate reductase assembly flavoprotein NrdI [Streptococcus pneumoniae D39]|nr:class Ib ribonucleoside-diphosphate reductase assembly flavoprotein NrdI [Streptococcus pneumoniae D39]